MSTLLLIRGLPGSGKSTLASSLVGFVHCEADQYFTDEDGTYNFDPALIPDAHAACQAKARAALEAGFDVVVANTFVKTWEATAYLDMADEVGATVSIVKMETRFESVHGVPKEVMERMAAAWEEF